MKALSSILTVIGVLLLVIVALGRFRDDPYTAFKIRIATILVAANTAFILAVLTKLSEKK